MKVARYGKSLDLEHTGLCVSDGQSSGMAHRSY